LKFLVTFVNSDMSPVVYDTMGGALLCFRISLPSKLSDVKFLGFLRNDLPGMSARTCDDLDSADWVDVYIAGKHVGTVRKVAYHPQ
jgi:hypothetical protein